MVWINPLIAVSLNTRLPEGYCKCMCEREKEKERETERERLRERERENFKHLYLTKRLIIQHVHNFKPFYKMCAKISSFSMTEHKAPLRHHILSKIFKESIAL